jgi:predicted kinase
MVLVAMAGLPASGKSTLANQLAGKLPALILDKDRIRAALFPPEEIEYNLYQDDFCFDILLEVAAYLLKKGRHIILDGRPFAHRYQMDRLVKFAEQAKVCLKVIECTCSDESFRKRLEEDVSTGSHPAANRSFEMFLAMRAKADPLIVPRLLVNTDRPISECLTLCLDYVQNNPEHAA